MYYIHHIVFRHIVTSNMALAKINSSYLPCLVLGKSTKIPNGYRINLLPTQEETEVPIGAIIGSFKSLMNCEVSFLDEKGKICKGYVRSINKDGPLNFFISHKVKKRQNRKCSWVSFPYIFLNKDQSKIFCY